MVRSLQNLMKSDCVNSGQTRYASLSISKFDIRSGKSMG
jgi:hypothetical protein